MLTTTAAAARLGITQGRVRQLIRAGQLPATKAGRDWLINETDLAAAEGRPGRGGPRKGEGVGSIK
jgi:excisionase family DNA binding protein